MPPQHTSGVFFERAIELDERFANAPPTMTSAEAHALELAQLARDASSSPPGNGHAGSARRLAAIADLVRDELLACRGPLWELRWPTGGLDLGSHRWLLHHREELRHGIATGWTTNRRALDGQLAAIDRMLAYSTDRLATLYIHPPLRDHREFLAEELHPVARIASGLAHLPTGEQCFEARSRLLIWPGFDARRAERAAWDVLETPQMPGVDLLHHPAFGPSRLVPVWRANVAVSRGEQLLRHTHQDRHGPAVIAAVAAGALVDLALHRDGDEDAVATLREALPWIGETTFDLLVDRSAATPLYWLTRLEGYRAMKRLQGEMSSLEFHDQMQSIGALEPELIAEQLEKPR